MSHASMPAVWPADQVVGSYAHPKIRWTLFDDTALYHPALIASSLVRTAGLPAGAPGSGGAKAYELETWNEPAAGFLAARALAFARNAYHPGAWVVGSWVNVTASGEYGQPHSHTRASLSVVYFLDLGTNPPGNPHNGRFAFVDPRLAACCHEEPERLSRAIIPRHVEGLMFGFPSQLVHFVHLYRGERPRISVAWNFGLPAEPGL